MKKFLCLILFSVMALQLMIPGISAAVRGDVNNDSSADNKDVVALFRYVSGGTAPVNEAEADFNSDGEINNKDVTLLFRYLSESSLPDDPNEVYTTESGTKYTASGYSKAINGRFTITKDFVITFEEGAYNSNFNRISLTYSSSKPLHIFVTYMKAGSEKTDDFYLEAADEGSFNGLISTYLNNAKANNIKSVTINTCSGKSSAFSLSDLTTELVPVYNSQNYFIENSRFKVGIQLSWGGGINYIEDKTSNISGLTNLINRADTGRLVQQSYYGTGANGEYTPGSFNGAEWRYNPVQGGDKYGNASRLIDIQVNDNSVYIKAQPQDWSLDGQITPSYMENTYTVNEDTVRVDNRFIDYSGWTHPYTHQELPAFYTVSYLNRFTWYNGKESWTDAELSYRDDLQFWGDSRYAEDCRFFIKNGNTETWCSWTSSKDGFGIGLFVPNVDLLYAGKYSYNGSKDPANGATNYVAPLNTIKMVSYTPIEYSYLITTGTVAQIRQTFKANRDFAANESLHKNYISMRVDEMSFTDLDFSVEGCRAAVSATNSSEVTYSASEKALKLTATSKEDPQVTVDYTRSSPVLNASDYTKIEIEYMIPVSNGKSSYVTDLFLCTVDKMSPDGSERTRASLIKDGQYHTLTVKVGSLSFWTGKINRIRFDFFDDCAAGDVMYVRSIRLK